MLHILLLLLKIIGIFLAALLAILLLAVICVLVIPIRYRMLADGKLGEPEPLWAEVKVTWLLHAISATLSYQGKVCLIIRLLGFPVFNTAKRKKKKRGKKKGLAEEKETPAAKEAAPAEKGIPTGNGDTPQAAEADTWERASVQTEPRIPESKTKTIGSSKDAADDGTDGSKPKGIDSAIAKAGRSAAAAKNKVNNFFALVLRIIQKLFAAIENIEYTIKELCGKIRNIVDNIRYYIEILQGEAFRRAFRNARGQLFRILKMVRPRKCRIYLHIGTGDPSSTGQAVAVYGMLYPWIGNNIRLEADFDQKMLEGDLLIKGRIQAIVFLLAAFRLYTDRNVKKIIKLLKREGS